jgi:hypothetical protein
MTLETCVGLSVGVGTWYACSRQSRVNIAIYNMYVGGAGIEEVTVKTRPPW